MINNIENWTEVTRGIYRYVIAAKVCYEIHVLRQYKELDIANLYLVGEWMEEDGISFERELLLEKQPIHVCVLAAYEDDKENNS